MSVEIKKILMYTITIYACTVEGIDVEYRIRDENQRTLHCNGR